MYKILVNSIRSYVDGSFIPKISANVSAYFCENIFPTEENPDEGQFLATLDIALDAMTIAQVINKEDPEEAKLALNEFVISQARTNSLMSMENLKKIKEGKDKESLAKIVADSIVSAIEPLVIWPARIEYPEE